LIHSPSPIKIIGDKSLSKRDFKRIAEPLTKIWSKPKSKKKRVSPLNDLWVKGSTKFKPIKFLEKKGSAQCKSAVLFLPV
jgi:3-phosphoshikimate 1-carboxyvinyltransferase